MATEGAAMRRYDEPIEVRAEPVAGPAGDEVGPAQFVWRRRLWRVLEVENRWFETADWWTKPGDDLLEESEVWRVVAASGRDTLPGVYELARGTTRAGESDWRLRAVVD
ncbi:MAG TPA: DUF6504 family protein [Polyangiaceae bacterium]|nr:DUF6504 family protein [Polyangiaceae bacterium]